MHAKDPQLFLEWASYPGSRPLSFPAQPACAEEGCENDLIKANG